MGKGLVKKSLVIGIIILFIGASIVPIVGLTIKNNFSTNNKTYSEPDNKYPSIVQSGGSSDWWNNDWRYCKKITIDNYFVAGDLQNFPLLVHDISSDYINHAQPDGDDFVFVSADNTTKYNHEIEMYDNSIGELVAWINITSLTSSSDTVLYMYYGNPTCSNQQNVHGTWDTDYLAVYHLTNTNDSTINDYDLTNYGGEFVVGKVGHCVDLENDQKDWLENLNFYQFGTGSSSDESATLECWANVESLDGGDNCYVGIFINYLNNGQAMMFQARSDSDKLWEWGGQGSDLYTPLDYNNWEYFTCTMEEGSSGDYYLFKNGAIKQSKFDTGTDWSDMSTDNLDIGKDKASDRYFDGKFDEIRISKTVRSFDYHKTSYYNQNNPNFMSIGPEIERSSTTNEPPIADFTYYPMDPSAEDIINFTDASFDSDGTIVSWWWDFGDHYFSDLQNPMHCYYYDGLYTVSLTIKDNNGLTNTTQKTIAVPPLDIVYVDDNYNPSTPGWGYNHFNKIQEGIDAVQRSTVHVYSGTYYENIVVDKSINLIGEDKNTTIIDGGGTGDVVYISADFVDISGFTIQHGYNGVHLDSSNENTVHGNIIVSNADDGVDLDSACYNNISENTIYSNGWCGISLSATNNNYNVISGNTISGNTYRGIDVESPSMSNQFYHNIFISNTVGNAFDNSVNKWYNATLKEGNYWDDYNGTDVNGDGKGDIPYNISGGSSQDLYPLGYFHPIANFTFTPSNPTTNTMVQFTDTSHDPDGSVDNRTWYFGDGTISYIQNPQHKYTAAGVYTVNLTVRDNMNKIGTCTKYVNVTLYNPTEQLDQQQTKYSNKFVVYSSTWAAQSFKPTLATLTSLKLYVDKKGSPSTNLVVSIRSSLTGSDLTVCSKTAGQIPTTISWIDFNFDDISVTPESTYYIVFRTSDGSSSNAYEWGYGYSTSYTRGSFWKSTNSGSTWLQDSSNDFCFKTYGTG